MEAEDFYKIPKHLSIFWYHKMKHVFSNNTALQGIVV